MIPILLASATLAVAIGIVVLTLRTRKALHMDFSTIEAKIAANTDATASAAQLLTLLSSEIATLKGGTPADQAKIDALAQKLSDATASLSAAITANTPAAPAAPVDTPAA